MQFTRFTDYALRVLIFVSQRPDEWVTIRQVAEAHDISRNHLMKVVSYLGARGYLVSQRGPGGGVRLQVPAEQVRLSDVILDTEGELDLLPPESDIVDELREPHERLGNVMREAVDAFIRSLESSSLADLVEPVAAPQRISATS